MGRHEIRLRRNRMTSRRMERHKNYQDILRQHRKQQRSRLVRILLYLLALIALVFIIYLGFERLSARNARGEEKIRPVTAQISRPDIVSPMNYKNGKSQKPPT